MAVSIYVTARAPSQIPRLPQPTGRVEKLAWWGVLTRMMSETIDALRNPSFRWLFLGVLVVFLMVGVDASLNLYMNTFFWELRSSDLLLFYVASPLGVMFGALFTSKLNQWFDKKPAVVWGTSWWAVCQIAPVALRMLDTFPQNGATSLVVTLVVVKFVQGVGVAQALVTFSSMIADVADENELRNGKRQEGIFFAAVSFANKCTTGLGNIVAGVALDLIAWPRGPQIQTAADVPAETIHQLGLLYGPIVAGFVIVCVWCYSHYHLTQQRHQEIMVALTRDAASEAGSGRMTITGADLGSPRAPRARRGTCVRHRQRAQHPDLRCDPATRRNQTDRHASRTGGGSRGRWLRAQQRQTRCRDHKHRPGRVQRGARTVRSGFCIVAGADVDRPDRHAVPRQRQRFSARGGAPARDVAHRHAPRRAGAQRAGDCARDLASRRRRVHAATQPGAVEIPIDLQYQQVVDAPVASDAAVAVANRFRGDRGGGRIDR